MRTSIQIGQRLKEERERLRLTQTTFGTMAGVVLRTQVNYESGVRWPDAGYLHAIAQHGVDILYVVTGKRSEPVPPEWFLPDDEMQMLTIYRASNSDGQALIRELSKVVAKTEPANVRNPPPPVAFQINRTQAQ